MSDVRTGSAVLPVLSDMPEMVSLAVFKFIQPISLQESLGVPGYMY